MLHRSLHNVVTIYFDGHDNCHHRTAQTSRRSTSKYVKCQSRSPREASGSAALFGRHEHILFSHFHTFTFPEARIAPGGRSGLGRIRKSFHRHCRRLENPSSSSLDFPGPAADDGPSSHTAAAETAETG